MGKANSRKKRAKMSRIQRKIKMGDNLESMSIDELLERAQDQIDCYQPEKAQKYCQEALKRDPDNVSALETSASLCLEGGNIEGAKHCLGRAITLRPEEGHSKYLSMAQLLEGKESLQCYLKGIELIQIKLSSLQTSEKPTAETEVEMTEDLSSIQEECKETTDERENEPPGASTSSMLSEEPPQSTRSTLMHQMSSAYCSIAELFMTDLCDEENAESQCQTNINKSIEADPSNPESYQNMASYLLVKQEVEQAKEFIKKSLDLWLPKYKAVNEGQADAGSFDPVEVCPVPYPMRINCAKILIEVEEHNLAVDVLEGLAQEDDGVVDTWYLLGWSSYLRGEEHLDNARLMLHRAMEVHKAMPSSDMQLIEHLEELLEELGPLPEEEDAEEGDLEQELEEDSEEDNDEGMDIS